ncbi:MAG: ABC transporter ATP-binding protein [Halapricum sp.]
MTENQPTAEPPEPGPAGDTALEAVELTKAFGDFVANEEVSLRVPENEFHAIIGPNGAGKTTLFNMIAGSLRPTSGVVRFDGDDITDRSEHERARLGISRAFQMTQIFGDQTVLENLRLAAQSTDQRLDPLAKPDAAFEERAYSMFEKLGLGATPETTASALSHGDKKKLEIGMSLVTDPDVLLLDEPTSGVSENESQEVTGFLDEFIGETTILMIEHDIDIVLNLSDRITVLHQGSVIARGTPGDITENEAVQKAYLGGY